MSEPQRYPNTSEFKPSSNSDNVSPDQISRPKEIPLDTTESVSVLDARLEGQAKSKTGDSKEGKVLSEREKKRQAEIAKTQTPQAKERLRKRMDDLERRAQQAEAKRFEQELQSGKRKSRFSSPEELRNALAAADEDIKKEQAAKLVSWLGKTKGIIDNHTKLSPKEKAELVQRAEAEKKQKENAKAGLAEFAVKTRGLIDKHRKEKEGVLGGSKTQTVENPEDEYELFEVTEDDGKNKIDTAESSTKKEKTQDLTTAVSVFLDEGAVAVKNYLLDVYQKGNALTKEDVIGDVELQKILKSKFVKKRDGLNFKDFLDALPTKEEYVERAMANITRLTETEEELTGIELADVSGEMNGGKNYSAPASKAATAGRRFQGVKKIDPTGGFVSSNLYALDDQEEQKIKKHQNASLSDRYRVGRSETTIITDPSLRDYYPVQEARAAYNAYLDAFKREYPKKAVGRSNIEIASAKLPFWASKNLKNLYTKMLETGSLIKDQEDKEAVAKKVMAYKQEIKAAGVKNGISEELAQKSRESSELEMQKGVPRKQEEINRITDNFLTHTERVQNVQNAASENVSLEELDKSLEEDREPVYSELEAKADLIKRRLQEIELYFADKNPEAKTKTARQYLLGSDIKGWFKGEQKRLQQEYKDLYNNDLYQKYLQK